jgi:predicted dehydrogenase
MKNGKLRVGIAGRRGISTAGGFRALPQAELTAMCDVDEARLNQDADQHEIPQRFTRFADMLDHVDAVVVSTPMQLHAPQAVMALKAGKHVLSEVTACVSLEECWQLADAVRTSGAMYMMAENYCYMRDNVLIHAMAGKGLFGDVYYGEGEYLHDVKFLHHNSDGSPTWRYYWQVGQNGSTYPTHSLGPVMQWFTAVDPSERIESVVCVGTGRHTDPEHPQDDTSILLCKLRSGKLIRVRVDMMSNRPHHMTYYTLQGTQGVYEASRLDNQRGNVWLGENPGAGPVRDEHRKWMPIEQFDEHLPEHWKNPPPEALRAGHGGGDYFVVKDFVDAVENETKPPIDVYTALEWTAAGLCSQISIANGGAAVKVPDFSDLSQRPVTLDAPPAIP